MSFQLVFSQTNTKNETSVTKEVSEDNERYSVFNDFRVPVRENINESDLLYDGWKTDPGRYAFRCKDGKRVRLTLWYLNKGTKETMNSEFINVTEELDKCLKNDPEFIAPIYRKRRAKLLQK
ncbi:hypothetical protein FHR24_001534 [Wenyingzhuangia heitensis]|uniref:Uncharacterized protein n=1 Tax=Wenyingzhuangia heitensis TaxID=1487859 RepID=A0ABX0UAY2_9FLAO|nr:hypothetical protein [Wenyingzhuangia heitensis]NIJ45095.1 hypothetical protein [Wenyingzhuangia heitensis]